MQGFVFGAGSFYGLREIPDSEHGDVIIAADGGYRICKELGIVPDLLLGDFDSLEDGLNCRHIPVERVPVEKDDTDLFLAVKKLLAQGCDTLHLYGGTGGARLDHTIANLQILLYIRRQNARGYLYDADFVWTVIENESFVIKKTVEWGLCSVFSLGGQAEGVSEQGLQYQLTNGILHSEYPMGVSNHILEPEAMITVRQGALLVGWELPTLYQK